MQDLLLVLGFHNGNSKTIQQDWHKALDDLLEVLSGPCDAGLTILHSSMRRFWESEFEGSDENLAYWTKKLIIFQQ